MPPKRTTKKAAPKGKKANSSKKVPTVQKRKTGFLDLQTETRSIIYRLALTRAGIYTLPDRKEPIPDGSKTSHKRPPVVLHEPGLLATCRQVRSEALPVFWGTNTFSAKYALYGPKLVKQLGPERTAMLTALRVCGTEMARFTTVDRFEFMVTKHASRVSQVAGGSLSKEAVIVPVGHGASGGWQKLTEAKNIKIVEADGTWSVEWVGRELDIHSTIYDYRRGWISD